MKKEEKTINFRVFSTSIRFDLLKKVELSLTEVGIVDSIVYNCYVENELLCCVKVHQRAVSEYIIVDVSVLKSTIESNAKRVAIANLLSVSPAEVSRQCGMVSDIWNYVATPI